jgi:hypothetical protein
MKPQKIHIIHWPHRRISSYLGCLSSDLTGTSERAVHLTTLQGDGQVNGQVLQRAQAHIVLHKQKERFRFEGKK